MILKNSEKSIKSTTESYITSKDFDCRKACPYFGKCGGCSLQHIPYDVQLQNKKKQLYLLTGYDDIKIFSGNPTEYRNRMDFIFHTKGIGLRERGKWYKIVDIEKCAIANAKINILLNEIRHFNFDDAFDIKKHSGTMRYAVIRAPKLSTSISFVLNSDSMRTKKAIDAIKEFSTVSSAENIAVTYVKSNTDVSVSDDYFILKGSEMLKESYLGHKFLFHIQGFFQNNTEMAEKMHKYCNSLLEKYSDSRELIDLYGGVGTFGILNAEFFEKTTIIENSEQCISAAEKNIKLNKAKNVTAVKADAKQIKHMTFSKDSVFIVDPPRSGMHPKVLSRLNEIKPKAIVYVSCNPQQMARDLKKLSGYDIKSIAMFDLFPQTNHMEAVVELSREPATS